jgi:cell wall-associated NlpC family hydrolase
MALWRGTPMKPDRRLTPARPDLAARHLAGTVEAERFADATRCRVTAGTAPMRAEPDPLTPFDTELLHGEEIAVYEIAGPWAWGQSALDGYVGYVPAPSVASTEAPAPTHRVATLWANVYARPALKSPPFAALPFAARVAVAEQREGFARIAPASWVSLGQLAPLAEPVADWVATARRFVGTPYLWGGRSPAGLDCSALVQLARQSAGHACPRDSDMQAALGRALGPGEALGRGDLVFWRGHVGIMLDGQRMLHANGHHMATVIEPLDEAVARIEAAGGGPVTRHARLDAPGPTV